MCSGILRYKINAESGMEDEISLSSNEKGIIKETDFRLEKKITPSSFKGNQYLLPNMNQHKMD